MCRDSWKFGNPGVAGGYPKPTVWWTESFSAKICGLFLSLCLVLHRLQQVSNILHVDPSVPRFVPSSIVIPTGVETSESHGQQTTDFRGSNFFHWNTLEILVETFAISHISHDAKYCFHQCTMEWLMLSTMPGSRLHQDRRVSRRDISGDGATRWKLLVLSVRLVCFSCVLERNIDVQCLFGRFEMLLRLKLTLPQPLNMQAGLLIVVGPCFRRIFLSGYSDTPDSHVLLLWVKFLQGPSSTESLEQVRTWSAVCGWVMNGSALFYWFKVWYIWSIWYLIVLYRIYSVHGCNLQLHLQRQFEDKPIL